MKASGKISAVDDGEEVLLACPPLASGEDVDCIEMSAEDIYKDLRLRGYEYEGQFKGIVKAQSTGKPQSLSLYSHWLHYLLVT